MLNEDRDCHTARSLSKVKLEYNIHEIWHRLLWGEHILYIRAKMTSFFNSR